MQNLQNRIIRWVILLAVGFAIGSLIGVMKTEHDETKTPLDKDFAEVEAEQKTAAVSIGGAFELIDHNGQNVTQENYADKYKLMFFGFTFCPAVCPTELQKLAVIMNDLPEDIANKVTPIFVSVDPERDSPEVIKEYIAQFHPKMVGLTGAPEQIEKVKKSYRVYAAKVENEMMDGYMIDHSAFMYLMSPENTMIALYPSKDKAVDIAKDVSKKLEK